MDEPVFQLTLDIRTKVNEGMPRRYAVVFNLTEELDGVKIVDPQFNDHTCGHTWDFETFEDVDDAFTHLNDCVSEGRTAYII
jgi:hypothetical protein